MKTVLNPPAIARDIALLVARVLLGVVLIAHGLQKFVEWTIGGTAEAFGEMGVALPGIAAPVAAVVELIGGLLLLVGAFTAITGLIVALQMGVAAVIVHIGNGVFIDNGGWELVGVIAAAALAVAAAGAGRYSIDALLTRKQGTVEQVAAQDREPANA